MTPSIQITKFPLLPMALFKGQPSRHIFHYRAGSVRKSGPGLSGTLVTTSDTLVAVPVSTLTCPFSLGCMSSDHQSVTIQGISNFVCADAAKLAAAFDFSVATTGNYSSEDPLHLHDRLTETVAAAVRATAVKYPLSRLLAEQQELEVAIRDLLTANKHHGDIGIRLQSYSIISVTPSPDIVKALEAIRSEELKKGADTAIHERQIAAETQDRVLQQAQIETKRQVQESERQILEAAMETQKREAVLKRDVQELDLIRQSEASRHERDERVKSADLLIEISRKEVEAEAERAGINRKTIEAKAANRVLLGEAEGKALAAAAEALRSLDPKIVQSLALQGGDSRATIAAAFLELADKAAKIGNLSITPDLLESLTRGNKE